MKVSAVSVALLFTFLALGLLANGPEARPTVLIPQVWVDTSANLFHAPGCKKISEKMTRLARTIAKMQSLQPAPECAETDAQAKERWKAFVEKMEAEHVGGFSDFGETVKPPKKKAGEKKTGTSAEAQPKAEKREAAPSAPSHNEVMAASNFYDARDVIGRKCSQQWGGNTDMVSYCVDKQLTALGQLQKGRPFGADPDKWSTARVKCAGQWPDDYSMRVHCEGKAGF